MLIGDKETFGVEYELEPMRDQEEYSRWLFGRMCYWAAGQVIGHWNSGAALRIVYVALCDVFENKGRRSDAMLFALPSKDMFNHINRALFLDDSRTDEQVQKDWDYYSRFIALPSGIDMFDGWKAFIVNDGNCAKLVWQNEAKCGDVYSIMLTAEEFDCVIGAFLKEVASL